MCSVLLVSRHDGQYKHRLQRNPVDREYARQQRGLPRRQREDARIVVMEIIALHRRCNDN